MSDSSPESTEQFLTLLDLAYDVSQSLKGKKVEDPRLPDCQQLAAKVFMHAASIYWLSRGTKAPVPRTIPSGSDFVDFSSIAVLARAALKAYLRLFEVFFEDVSEDEREFRYQLWQLSGMVVREMHMPTHTELTNHVEQSKSYIAEIRRRLSSTHRFRSSSQKQQRAYLEGRPPKRKLEDLAKSAGFNENTVRLIYSYYSAYAHADGLSGIQNPLRLYQTRPNRVC